MKLYKSKKNIIAALLFTVFILSSCGGSISAPGGTNYMTPQATAAPMAPEYAYDGGEYGYTLADEEKIFESGTGGAPEAMLNLALSGETQTADAEQKIIKTAHLDAETKDMAEFETSINELLEVYGGYNEYSNIYVYDSGRGLKSGHFTLRIPSENYESLKRDIISICNVLSQSDSSQNATTEYRDTEARLSTKKAEEKRLLEMIDKANKIEDLILLEERLSNVRTDIELYESRLKNIDRLASFSTINVNITEVKEETVKEISSDDLFSKMKGSFNASINFIIRAFETIAVLLSGLILPLSVIAAPVVIIILVIKVKNKRKSQVKKGDL